ncbi:MAG: Class SAM-dependent methyltransferase [Actinomycetota bacterium]|nr:Class SAM-dependent methyltransferase [Actinomycetota bacterium]
MTGDRTDSAGPVQLSDPVRLGGPAAGGTCVGHAPGTTIFVRGGLPGESVRVRVTGTSRGGRITFADVTDVLDPSPHRVVPPCPLTASCGGCDLQHVAVEFQREWKAQVLRDQLGRIGRVQQIAGVPLTQAVTVQGVEMPEAPEGLGWRTRVGIDTDAKGRACFHSHRSGRLVPIDACPVVVPQLQDGFGHTWPAKTRVDIALGEAPTAWAAGPLREVPAGWRSTATVTRAAQGRRWRVGTGSFWQAHALAPEVLLACIREFTAPQAGEAVLDLYAGVGLFAGALAKDVGDDGRVAAVEGDERAIRLARRNLHDLPSVRLHQGAVSAWLGTEAGREVVAGVDVIVLDPPRAGAGKEVVAALAASAARAIAFVACDGASLARDARTFAGHGWSLAALRAFDLFGMSHHVEAVALFLPPTSHLVPPTS